MYGCYNLVGRDGIPAVQCNQLPRLTKHWTCSSLSPAPKGNAPMYAFGPFRENSSLDVASGRCGMGLRLVCRVGGCVQQFNLRQERCLDCRPSES